MTPATRASLAARTAALVVCLACACLLPAASAAGAKKPTGQIPVESMHAYEQQLARGEIKAASFKTKTHSLHLTLADGHHVVTRYQPAQLGSLRAGLKAHHVSVVTKSAGHKLRYIAAGVLVVVVLVVIGGLLLVRRRRRAEEY